MISKAWKQLLVRFPRTGAAANAELLSALLEQYDHCGISETEYECSVEWSVYFELAKCPARLSEQFRSDLAKAGAPELELVGVMDVPYEAWHEAWRDHFKPVWVSPRICVCPPWLREERDDDSIEIVIEPGMAFGTGTHATTQLCLRLAERHLRKGITVLDVGTGSAILCIAAVKLGARLAVGFDNDPDVRENVAENLRLNGIADGRIQVFVGNIDALGSARFDLVLCNMLSNQFLPIVDRIAGLLARGGRAVFSGFLVNETDLVKQVLSESDMEPVATDTLDEWGGLVARRIVSA